MKNGTIYLQYIKSHFVSVPYNSCWMAEVASLISAALWSDSPGNPLSAPFYEDHIWPFYRGTFQLVMVVRYVSAAERNPLCPAYSEAAAIFYDEDKGRLIKARRDIKVHVRILVEARTLLPCGMFLLYF
jgi:hypothetical protein